VRPLVATALATWTSGSERSRLAQRGSVRGPWPKRFGVRRIGGTSAPAA
jgi:hypothetical protein